MEADVRQIEIAKIALEENVREENGDMSELVASIKAHGILQPLILGDGNVLIAGHRRLAAAKLAGLKVVPVRVLGVKGELERNEMRLVENLQRQDLTVLEEARAFDDYLHRAKKTSAELAAKIGKTQRYVDNRLLVLKLEATGQKALEQGKISIKHVVLLSKLGKESQKKVVEHVIEENVTAQQLADELSFMELKEDELPDEVKLKIKKRAQLTFNSAGELARGDIAELASKELAAYLEREREALRAKGILVFADQEALLEAHPKAKEIRYYDESYNEAVKRLSNSKHFAVVLSWAEYGGVSRGVYVLDRAALQEELQEKAKAKKTKAQLEKEKEETATQLNLSRQERLEKNVAEFRHNFHISKARELLQPGKVVNAILLHEVNHLNPSNGLKMTPAEQTKALLEAAKSHLGSEMVSPMEASAFAAAAGVDAAKHFELTGQYLELYTKDDLVALAKELKIELADETAKKPELMEQLQAGWKKGMVPKIFVERR